jgi:hypothetical protein
MVSKIILRASPCAAIVPGIGDLLVAGLSSFHRGSAFDGSNTAVVPFVHMANPPLIFTIRPSCLPPETKVEIYATRLQSLIDRFAGATSGPVLITRERSMYHPGC